MWTTASLSTTVAHMWLRLGPLPYTAATSAITAWLGTLTGEMQSKPTPPPKPAPLPTVLIPQPHCTAPQWMEPPQLQARPSPLPTLQCTAERGAADTEPVRDPCFL